MTDLFDPTKAYGRAIEWGWVQVGSHRGIGYTSVVDKDDAVRCLIDDANDYLPVGSRFEIRQTMGRNYGRTKGVAWIYSPEFAGISDWQDTDKSRFDGELGVLVLARATVPPKPSTELE